MTGLFGESGLKTSLVTGKGVPHLLKPETVDTYENLRTTKKVALVSSVDTDSKFHQTKKLHQRSCYQGTSFSPNGTKTGAFCLGSLIIEDKILESPIKIGRSLDIITERIGIMTSSDGLEEERLSLTCYGRRAQGFLKSSSVYAIQQSIKSMSYLPA
ncbi:hypothetical protein NPIL_558921 [Nephila pilipes]|uniref:Uncharacterized protein n=1 Tax=Nephila pilipes TaxID=299642 RepID=A0A8X6N7I2_NEPPI|nr:hypothetical protein NPIL_558921 [Nephila pilipes]